MRYEALGSAIESAVRNACEGKEVGVVFSGGMDSGLIAALAKHRPIKSWSVILVCYKKHHRPGATWTAVLK